MVECKQLQRDISMLVKINLKTVISSIIFILTLSSLSLYAHADNRFYQKPSRFHDRYQTYSYVYYPHQQAYYAPDTRLWYWSSGNHWHSAYYAPRSLDIDLRIGGIPISLQSALPYHEHAFVVRNYHYDNEYAYNSRHERKYYQERNKYNRKQYRRNNRHHDDDDDD